MSSSIPVLGYPCRTDAVLAMRAQGKTTEAIADALGITTKQVVDLEASRRRVQRHARSGERGGRKAATELTSQFTYHLLERLRPHAARRDMSADRLIRTIVERVVEDGLVDAVLDDRKGRS